MSRRSTRLQAKALEESTPASTIAPSSGAVAKPATKKRKVASESNTGTTPDNVEGQSEGDKRPSTISARPKRGSLKKVLELPVDILLEVFQHLDPIDLLNLAKTDRTLRAYLLKRSVAFPWWKAAFERVDPKPPTCPADLSLPQYAHLLYGRTCFYCNTTQGVTRSWSAYIRACKNCLSDDKLFVISNANAGQYLRRITSSITFKNERRYSVRYPRAEWVKNLNDVQRLENKADKKELDAFINTKTNKIQQRDQRARIKFHNWDHREARNKEQDLRNRRFDRRQDILKKLRESGYAAELKRLGQWEINRLPGLNGIKPLTDNDWERVKPGIIAVFDGKQRDVDNAQRCKLISKRTALLKNPLRYSLSQNRELDLPRIPITQLAKLEPFRTLIYDTPEKKELQEKHLMKHVDAIPEALNTWKAEAEEALFGLLPASATRGKKGKAGSKSKGKVPELDKTLNLATNIFYCKWCGPHHPLTYPFVLEHECLFQRHAPEKAHDYRSNKNPRKREEDRQIAYLNEEDKGDPNASWNEGGNQLVFFKKASEFASAIVLALEGDPGVVTWEELDEANERVECLHCRLPDGGNHRLKRVAMDWRQAVLHQLDSYKIHSKFQMDKKKKILTFENSWKKLDAQSLAKAYQKEEFDVETDTSPRCSHSHYCVECGILSLNKDGTVDTKSGHRTTVKAGATKCSKGHVLKKKGTFSERYHGSSRYDPNVSFAGNPKPVKIP